MTTPDLESRLEQVRTAYDAVGRLRERCDELQTVEQARGAYETLLAGENAALAALQQRLEALELERRRRTLPDEVDEGLEPWKPVRRPPPDEPDRTLREEVDEGLEPWKPVRTQPDRRRRLAGLANRFQHVWSLDADLLGRINRIAEDAERPLGEALALLPWRAFAEPCHQGEAEAAHLARLAEWQEALADYRRRLEGDIDLLETRFRGWLGIWELWRGRGLDAAGQARWDTFIAQRRAALLGDVFRLGRAVADAEARLRAGGAP